jgi:hypothetical protein
MPRRLTNYVSRPDKLRQLVDGRSWGAGRAVEVASAAKPLLRRAAPSIPPRLGCRNAPA